MGLTRKWPYTTTTTTGNSDIPQIYLGYALDAKICLRYVLHICLIFTYNMPQINQWYNGDIPEIYFTYTYTKDIQLSSLVPVGNCSSNWTEIALYNHLLIKVVLKDCSYTGCPKRIPLSICCVPPFLKKGTKLKLYISCMRDSSCLFWIQNGFWAIFGYWDMQRWSYRTKKLKINL